LLERYSITCKLCQARFESLGDMERHVLVEHFQKGEIPTQGKRNVHKRIRY